MVYASNLHINFIAYRVVMCDSPGVFSDSQSTTDARLKKISPPNTAWPSGTIIVQ